MASIKDNPVVKRVLETSEAQVGKVVQQVLSNEGFVGVVQGAVTTALSAKGLLDKNIRAALAAAHDESMHRRSP